MGIIDVRKVFRMTVEMAKYEIGEGAAHNTVRFFMRPKDESDLSLKEVEARDVIVNGYLELGGQVGSTIDPFKAAESILADHYGYAKMVEACYTWKPRVRY